MPRRRGQASHDERIKGLYAARVSPQGPLEGPSGAAGVSRGGAGPGAKEPRVCEEGRRGRRACCCCCCCCCRSRGAVEGHHAVLVGPQVEEAAGAIVFAVVVVVVAFLIFGFLVIATTEAVEHVVPPPERRQAPRRQQPDSRVRARARWEMLLRLLPLLLEGREGAARVAGEEVGVREQGGVGRRRACEVFFSKNKFRLSRLFLSLFSFLFRFHLSCQDSITTPSQR